MPSETILICAEDPIFSAALRNLLEQKGCVVRIAESGEEALALLSRMIFSVVIATLRSDEKITGLQIVAEHELRCPKGLKILLTHDFSKRLMLIANFIGARCVSESTSPQDLVERIEDFADKNNR
jgi:DNA-binding NtrC family response regulator